MKRNIKSLILILLTIIFPLANCTKILEEQPRASVTPDYFTTPGGVLGGITGVYSDMRNLWGTEGFLNMVVGGTDEVLKGGSGNPNFFEYGIVNSDIAGLWNIAYQDINTINGVLQYGATIDLPDATRKQYLAQAKFLRAFYYFYLVQTYGDVPLHLQFVTTASTADSRAPIADVYAQIIKDLTDATADLPAIPTAPFLGKAATSATAKYLLAKAYLTRGWSAATVSGDFQTAYTLCTELIANKATYGLDLWQDFATVNIKANDYGKEVLFVIDHSSDLKYGEYTTGQFAAGAKENKSNFYFRPNYPTVTANYPLSTGTAVMIRDIPNGRPFIRVRPNGPYLINQAFADRINDSRWDNTFQVTWIANNGVVVTPRGTLTPNIDTAIWTPPFEVSATRRAAFKGIIVTPSGAPKNDPTAKNSWDPAIFPSMNKYDDATRASLNDGSTRPFVMFKFSEVYLIAAEAAFKGGGTLQNAADMLNVLRQRAAFRPKNTVAQNAAAVAAVTITPAQVTLDFILDERTRELYGEYQRWWDLVRTRTLSSRLNTWNKLEAYPKYALSNPPDAFMLRPVPQTQIDLVTAGPPFPQNPGY
jgi:starch-binding outer membrane protein, SusD/RagB family